MYKVARKNGHSHWHLVARRRNGTKNHAIRKKNIFDGRSEDNNLLNWIKYSVDQNEYLLESSE